MVVNVYHSKSMDNYFGKEKPKADDLELVATVNTTDLEEAFKLTNHVEGNWIENENVTALVERARSTSCGDVMVREGKAYIVAMCGFEEVDVKLN